AEAAALAGATDAIRTIHRQVDLVSISGFQHFLARLAVDEAGGAIFEIQGDPVTHASALRTTSDVINIDDLPNIVVLQDDFLPYDLRVRPAHVQSVKGGPKETVCDLIAVAQRMPVKPQVDLGYAMLENLDIADLVTGSRLGVACTGSFRLDAENPVLKSLTIGIVDQRYLALRILD